jgi:hypothetical protein
MRYALVAFYDSKDISVASNCIHTALQRTCCPGGDHVVIAGVGDKHVEPSPSRRKSLGTHGGSVQKVLIWNERLGNYINI